MCTNRKDDIFRQRRLYIDKSHTVLDIFRSRGHNIDRNRAGILAWASPLHDSPTVAISWPAFFLVRVTLLLLHVMLLRFPDPSEKASKRKIWKTFSHRGTARIKKLILRKLFRTPKNLGVDTFPDPSAILGPPNGHFGFCRRCRRWASTPGARRC